MAEPQHHAHEETLLAPGGLTGSPGGSKQGQVFVSPIAGSLAADRCRGNRKPDPHVPLLRQVPPKSG